MAAGETLEQVMDTALDAVHTALQDDARCWARQLRATASLVQAARVGGGADRAFVELEIAGSWSVGQATATRLMVEAEHMTTCLPATLAALETGVVLVHQARVLLQVTRTCPPELARQVELEVLDRDDLAAWWPADLRALATRVLLRLESEAADAAADDADDEQAQEQAAASAEERRQRAAAQRRTWTAADGDGMGAAGAVLTAEQLGTWTAGMDALEAQERRTDRDAGIDRTADQRRADLFAALPALVLAARADGAASNPGAVLTSVDVRPQVVLHVHVPMATVLDLSAEPGQLDGYGPVSAEHVRSMRPTAYRRVLIDADTGRPITLDDRLTPLPEDAEHPERCWQQLQDELRDALVPTVVVDRAEPGHDPSARLSRLVDVRDRRCSGPGCGQTRTHRDHADPWPTGPTAAWNLQRLSARCHRAKHAGWSLDRHHDGSVTWHSPLGRTYTRPSPHSPPPTVDLHAPSPPRRPPPRRPPPEPTGVAWSLAVTARGASPDAEPHPRAVLPDDPPF